MTDVVRRRFDIHGIVQGVGFRPFVYGLAMQFGLTGFVLNDSSGVQIEVQGAESVLREFQRLLTVAKPPLARIDEVLTRDLPLGTEDDFSIRFSERGQHSATFISPDVATCADCLADIADTSNRRYRYPFTNCTNCGPRFTITLTVPYDRPNTTMAPFAMCDACAAEYNDPSDRRFHAQPICCPDCGPTLSLENSDGSPASGDAVVATSEALRQGRIVAIKGLGGYHLACDATNNDAVATLRSRKHREEKPFALMVADATQARKLVDIDADEQRLLQSHRAPIVLMRRLASSPIAFSVAPGNPHLGVMLAYTPLHHLLLAACGFPLVMTSANLSDEPIAYDDSEAHLRLAHIADMFLTHNRVIHMRCDDSVVRVQSSQPSIVRRSRGYAPEPIRLHQPAPACVLAVGAELKHSFCLASGDSAFVSHHIGDLENWETMKSFVDGMEHYSRIFDLTPEVVAYDPHPDYLSTKWVMDNVGELPSTAVQHHHAHIASVLAETGFDARVIGVAFDGTGWGPDETVWGGEILIADLVSYERVGHLRTVALAGGSAAIREPWRMAVSYMDAAFGDSSGPDVEFTRRHAEQMRQVKQLVRKSVNSPLTSSAGRLFDAVAAVCGVRDSVAYEGQAAIEFEALAAGSASTPLKVPVDFDSGRVVIDSVALFAGCVEMLEAGQTSSEVSAAFHGGLADAVIQSCELIRQRTSIKAVALSGGTWQNQLLSNAVTSGLASRGFTVLTNSLVPTNDGGISFGQAAVAAARHKSGLLDPPGYMDSIRR